ncbi:MAG: glucokinase [Phycisphaeraceae bacterium]|nr:MAG: glucokinase [Phycisphaeraceae bacterium]
MTPDDAKLDIPPSGLTVGVDLGGTNIQIGVLDPAGTVLGRAKRKTQADEGREAILNRIAEGIEEAAGEAGVKVSDLPAIGIGAPGAVDPREGVVIEAPNLRWNRVPLAADLTKMLGPQVFLDNDVNAAVFGESRLGAGVGATDMVGVWVGTGVGAGLILDGKIFYGAGHTAGEIGHMILMPGNAPGSRSIEHNCSRTTVVNRLVQLIRANRTSIVPELVDGKLEKIKSKVIAQAYDAGDELTREVVRDAATRLGTALAGVVTLLSLERVILGGGLTEALGKAYVNLVRDAVKRDAFPATIAKEVEVRASELEDDAGVVGAGLIALHRLGV